MTFELPKDKIKQEFEREFKEFEIGHKLIFLDEVDSTNLYALQHSESIPDGTVILAQTQSAGRGRKGRTWHSPAGLGLYLTILLKKTLFQGESHFLNLLASLAVYDAIKEILLAGKESNPGLLPLELKWPNDIIYNSFKLGGILSEKKGTYREDVPTVVGIGINVNHKNCDFPEEIAANSISLFIIDSKKRELHDVAGEIVRKINYHFSEMRRKGSGYIINSWMQCSPASKGSRVRIISDNEEFHAVTEGLDQRGFLKVRRYGDRLQTLLSADIVSIRRS
jgi:BirA family biotin operon repressor/biotin-[acetyl-CoA-carboxylase] ligase